MGSRARPLYALRVFFHYFFIRPSSFILLQPPQRVFFADEVEHHTFVYARLPPRGERFLRSAADDAAWPFPGPKCSFAWRLALGAWRHRRPGPRGARARRGSPGRRSSCPSRPLGILSRDGLHRCDADVRGPLPRARAGFVTARAAPSTATASREPGLRARRALGSQELTRPRRRRSDSCCRPARMAQASRLPSFPGDPVHREAEPDPRPARRSYAVLAGIVPRGAAS